MVRRAACQLLRLWGVINRHEALLTPSPAPAGLCPARSWARMGGGILFTNTLDTRLASIMLAAILLFTLCATAH